MQMWVVSSLILAVWAVLKFVMHKSGYVHILLVLGLSILGVQIIAYRKTRYHALACENDDS